MDERQAIEAAGTLTLTVIVATAYFAGVSKGKEEGWNAAWKAKNVYDKKNTNQIKDIELSISSRDKGFTVPYFFYS